MVEGGSISYVLVLPAALSGRQEGLLACCRREVLELLTYLGKVI